MIVHILRNVNDRINEASFEYNGSGYIIRIGNANIGRVKIDFVRKTLDLTLDKITYDGMVRRTLFENIWKEFALLDYYEK